MNDPFEPSVRLCPTLDDTHATRLARRAFGWGLLACTLTSGVFLVFTCWVFPETYFHDVFLDIAAACVPGLMVGVFVDDFMRFRYAQQLGRGLALLSSSTAHADSITHSTARSTTNDA